MDSTGSKEGDLVAAVLLYAIRCLAEGDQPALAAMNFGPSEIETLKDLQLTDLYRMGVLEDHCLSIQLDRQLYQPLVDRLSRLRRAEDLRAALIKAGASQDIMQALFGIGVREYTRLRRLVDAAPSVGRPPEPDDESSQALWEAWSNLTSERTSAHLRAQDYLTLHEQTGLSVRAIWNLTQRWSEFGNLHT